VNVVKNYHWQLEVKYSPDQPRVSAGSPEGGRWTRGFTEHWAGSDVTVTDSLINLLDDEVGRADFGRPMTKGRPRWCQENARIEYQRQKAAGRSPVFVEGKITTITREEVLELADKAFRNGRELSQDELRGWLWPVQHAWVEVAGKIVDPTLFQVGTQGREVPVAQAFMFSRYDPVTRISGANDWVLKDPLTMPTEASERLSRGEP